MPRHSLDYLLQPLLLKKIEGVEERYPGSPTTAPKSRRETSSLPWTGGTGKAGATPGRR